MNIQDLPYINIEKPQDEVEWVAVHKNGQLIHRIIQEDRQFKALRVADVPWEEIEKIYILDMSQELRSVIQSIPFDHSRMQFFFLREVHEQKNGEMTKKDQYIEWGIKLRGSKTAIRFRAMEKVKPYHRTVVEAIID